MRLSSFYGFFFFFFFFFGWCWLLLDARFCDDSSSAPIYRPIIASLDVTYRGREGIFDPPGSTVE